MELRLTEDSNFVRPDRLEDDLFFAARRARLLAWTFQQMAVSEFSTTSTNEFLWHLGEHFLEALASELAKAAEIAEIHKAERVGAADARASSAWESYFRDYLMQCGRSAPQADAEVRRARAAMASTSPGRSEAA